MKKRLIPLLTALLCALLVGCNHTDSSAPDTSLSESSSVEETTESASATDSEDGSSDSVDSSESEDSATDGEDSATDSESNSDSEDSTSGTNGYLPWI